MDAFGAKEKKIKFIEGYLRFASLFKRTEQAESIVSYIPEDLQNAELTYDDFSDNIRYSYGAPFTHNHVPFAYGTTQMPLLKHFTASFIAASMVMGLEDFQTFVKYLFQPAKHNDALLELRPLLSIKQRIQVQHEAKGYKNRKIDWLFTSEKMQVLIDVKNRTGQTYEHLVDLVKNNGLVSEPKTNPESFFKSTVEKFEQRKSSAILQGIWVNVGIKENASALDHYFEKNIDHEKLQFFIICGWDQDCYIKTRTSDQKQYILDFFNLIESDKLVFR